MAHRRSLAVVATLASGLAACSLPATLRDDSDLALNVLLSGSAHASPTATAEEVTAVIDPAAVAESLLTDGRTGENAELVVRADPFDARHFVVAGMALSLGGNLRVGVTRDGGRHWQLGMVQKPADASLLNDPVLDFARDGSVLLAYIPAGPRSILGVELVRSVDGGAHFGPPQRFVSGSGPDDKTALVVDLQPASPYFGRAYLMWKHPAGGILVSRSDDDGRHWDAVRTLSGDPITGEALAVLRDGTLVVAANRVGRLAPGIVAYRSEDGGTSLSEAVAVSDREAGFLFRVPASCSVQGAFMQTTLALDGEQQQLLLAWDDQHQDGQCSVGCDAQFACRSHARVARSRDGGRSWSVPFEVRPQGWGDDDQFFSALAPERRDGRWWLSQRSTHGSAVRDAAHTWLLQSDDGEHWQEAVRMSSSASAGRGSRWQGDYASLAGSRVAAIAGWADLRNGAADLAVAAVEQPDDAVEALHGSYFDPAVENQGLLVDPGNGGHDFFAGWFTFDPSGGDAARPYWYVLQGHLDGDLAEFTVYRSPGGRFQGRRAGPIEAVGHGVARFAGCTRVDLRITLDGVGEVVQSLQRLLPSAACPSPNAATDKLKKT